MGNRATLTISNKPDFYANYHIPYLFLIPFKPENYHSDVYCFQTTANNALENFAKKGITIEKIEEKISNVIHVKSSQLESYRNTGKDPLYDGKDETDSIQIRLDLFEEDYPEISETYKIIQQLLQCKDDDPVTLNLKEIRSMYDEDEWYENPEEIYKESIENYKESLQIIDLDDFKDHDVFINHAHADKDFVAGLAENLRSKDLKVWYDDFELQVGDCLMDKIQDGLKKSRFGIVVLSQNFIENSSWAKDEFESLRAKEKIEGKLLILPIWRNDVSAKIVGEYNYALALRVALLESEGLDSIVDKLVYKISGP